MKLKDLISKMMIGDNIEIISKATNEMLFEGYSDRLNNIEDFAIYKKMLDSEVCCVTAKKKLEKIYFVVIIKGV